MKVEVRVQGWRRVKGRKTEGEKGGGMVRWGKGIKTEGLGGVGRVRTEGKGGRKERCERELIYQRCPS